MAVLITTARGAFKVTPDDATPFVYFVAHKDDVIFKSTGEYAGEIYIKHNMSAAIATTATDTEGDGVTLATSAAVSEWINSNR